MNKISVEQNCPIQYLINSPIKRCCASIIVNLLFFMMWYSQLSWNTTALYVVIGFMCYNIIMTYIQEGKAKHEYKIYIIIVINHYLERQESAVQMKQSESFYNGN